MWFYRHYSTKKEEKDKAKNTTKVSKHPLFHFIKFSFTRRSNTMVASHDCSNSFSMLSLHFAVSKAHGFATWLPSATTWWITKFICRRTTFVNFARFTNWAPNYPREHHNWLWSLLNDVVRNIWVLLHHVLVHHTCLLLHHHSWLLLHNFWLHLLYIRLHLHPWLLLYHIPLTLLLLHHCWLAWLLHRLHLYGCEFVIILHFDRIC